MGQGSSSRETWEGNWQLERRDGAEGTGSEKYLYKVRVSEGPDRLTEELSIGSQHGLLCGDIGADWQEAPAAACMFLAFAGDAGKSLGPKLTWRHAWVKEPSCLKTELRSSGGDWDAETLIVERSLKSASEMVVTVRIQKGEQSIFGPESLCFQRLPTPASGATGPSPVAFLRANGLPLRSAEDRIKVLEKVAQLVTENMDAISDAHAVDRVVPAKFDGTGRMILGGIASYKDLIPTWIEPETIPDLAPPPIKAGVEASWAIYNEPKGVCINIAPWNAPATLCLIPAISMLAAGNHVVIKPPDLVPTISALLRRLCQKYLDGYVWVEEGEKSTVERLIDEGADHLEFTGGGPVGSIVAARCAKTLTPVTLELGGKSPVFVDSGLSASMLDDAVREILETKVYKTGQFCCAHDYALVHDAVYADFCAKFKAEIEALGPERNILMIGRRQYEGMKKRLQETAGVECIPPLGGDFVPSDDNMTVPMTGLLSPALDNMVLTEEIFGPLLPIVRVSGVSEAIDIINRPVSAKPLIAYCYTQTQESERAFISNVSAGNIAVNGGPQRMIGNYAAGFGGIGPSGIGVGFWGKDALREFSSRKHVMVAKNGFAKSFFSGPPAPPK